MKAEWKSADDLLNFWSTDYGDDPVLKQLLMKKLDPKKENKKLADEYIKLLVVYVQGRSVILFRVSQSIQLGKVKKSFAEKVGQPVSSLEFSFEGQEIMDDETPMSCHMKNDDRIRVYLRQV